MTASAFDPALLQRAVEVLRQGGLVAYPTDTVYGLAALPTNADAMTGLFEAKKRNPDQPVSLLIDSSESVASIAADVPNVAKRLMQAFWPGALTIILPKALTFQSVAVGETVGLRVPDHPVPRDLARLLGGPITGTSANIAGGPEPLTAEAVRAQLGDSVDLVIDGGRCRSAQPSTVVDCSVAPPRIVREGPISREALERAAGTTLS